MADCGRRLEEWRTVDGACWLPWYAGVLMSGVWCLVFLPLRVLGLCSCYLLLLALCVACSLLY